MIPTQNVPTENLVVEKDTGFTYKLDLTTERVRKYVDNIESLKQAIYKILQTERYSYLAYNWQYGIETNDLYGQPKELVRALLPNRIKEALSIDDRIKDVVDFEFKDISKTELLVTFSVVTYDYEKMLQIEWGWNSERTNI